LRKLLELLLFTNIVEDLLDPIVWIERLPRMNLSKIKYLPNLYTDKNFKYLMLVLVIIISFAHLYQLGIVPNGLYLDETSIGYNAATISQSGIDEYGNHFPVYFKSFGEYKNPVYIYAAAVIFKLIGISDFTLRFTSFLFFIFGLIFTFLLVCKVFPKNRAVQAYLMLAFGFLPQFFTLSRISFEVISQLTFISAALWLVWKVFNEEPTKNARYTIIACGLVMGISVYTYSTARMLSFMMLAILWVVYLKRENFKKLAILTVCFVVALIPYIVFTIRKPNALIGRFDHITYIFGDLPIAEKISTFFNNLGSYLTLDYLIKNGDANLRHSIGVGGIIFSVTLVLFVIGLIVILTNKQLIFNRFTLFLLANLLISPLAGALTAVDNPHALRGMLLGYFILMISCFGLKFISEISRSQLKQVLMVGLFAFLLVEIGVYLGNYFIVYPAKSTMAFGDYGFEQSLQSAINQSPKEVVFFADPTEEWYAPLKYYSLIIKNPNNVPIKMDLHFDPVPETCYLFNQIDIAKLDSPIPYDEFESQYRLNRLEMILKVDQPKAIFKARCYALSQ
jgi:hypothetical protein